MKPMLAAKAAIENIPSGFIVSPKLDGVRGLIHNGQLLSRAQKPFPNEKLCKKSDIPEIKGLDGEFILGDPTDPDVFRKTSQAVRTIKGVDDLVFHVFDDFSNPDLPFQYRHIQTAAKVELFQKYGLPIQMVEHHATTDPEADVVAYIAQGYEGMMARHPMKPYKYGRSTLREQGLLKIKNFLDSEAVIIKAVEQMTNENEPEIDALGYQKRSSSQEGLVPAGVLGALVVKDINSGVEFSVGTGFNQEDRERLWHERATLPGRVITYTYFPVGVKDKPRFPCYKGFRV